MYHCRITLADPKQTPQLLVHDLRQVGMLSGSVLFRVRERLGFDIRYFAEYGKTNNVQTFWSGALDWLPLEPGRQVILFSITWDQHMPDRCQEVISEIESRTGCAVEIWSHRWPDGYTKLDGEVLVPPFDIGNQYFVHLTPEESTLLRLSLIAARTVPLSKIPESERRIADVASTLAAKKDYTFWNRLLNEPGSVLTDCQNAHLNKPITHVDRASFRSEGPANIHYFRLPTATEGQEERTLEASMREVSAGAKDVAYADQDRGETYCIYLYRLPDSAELPSLRCLVENLPAALQLAAPERWVGPQDAIHVKIPKAVGLDSILGTLQTLADLIVNTEAGHRFPDAIVARLMYLASLQALKQLDLLNRYTSDPAHLTIDPLGMRVLCDTSDRTGRMRHTLLLPIRASTAAAAQFLFANNGYNLQKLERHLEGVLTGLGLQQSQWQGLVSIPDRLRLDVQVPKDFLSVDISGHEVESIDVEDAATLNVIAKGSRSWDALERYGIRSLVILHESETIGPSVGYGLIAAEVARTLSERYERRVRILDLFAGSGTITRILSQLRFDGQIVSVDMVDAVIPREPTVSDTGDTIRSTRIRGDVWDAVRPDGFLTQMFDIVCLDPPHSGMFDLLFSPHSAGMTLISRVAQSADLLVLYPGHSSQGGRLDALFSALHNSYRRLSLLQFGQELVVLGLRRGDEIANYQWEAFVTHILERTRLSAQQFGWRVVELSPPS